MKCHNGCRISICVEPSLDFMGWTEWCVGPKTVLMASYKLLHVICPTSLVFPWLCQPTRVLHLSEFLLNAAIKFFPPDMNSVGSWILKFCGMCVHLRTVFVKPILVCLCGKTSGVGCRWLQAVAEAFSLGRKCISCTLWKAMDLTQTGEGH